ncbi:UNVERIFIED_CONTAM: hypothetical protein Scaly_1621400 [Sesamum calycinum]|uniref:Integrase catalytic domain-containing protein n=1 Tax=Sesamum calycinum TaxID=2727403 RepID=A0AAW2P8V2_9LAMI
MPEQEKWVTKLLGYSFGIHFKPVRENVVADALSCLSEASLVFLVVFFSEKGGFLYHRHRLFIPPQSGIASSLLHEFHSSLVGGHFETKTTLARLSGSFYWPDIYRLHRAPKTIVCDHDPIFISQFWKELFCLIETTLSYSSTYHPQIDGLTVVLNHCLEKYLRCFVSALPQTWTQFLPLVEFWYNTTFHSSIGMSSFEALYDWKPPTLVGYYPDKLEVRVP